MHLHSKLNKNINVNFHQSPLSETKKNVISLNVINFKENPSQNTRKDENARKNDSYVKSYIKQDPFI